MVGLKEDKNKWPSAKEIAEFSEDFAKLIESFTQDGKGMSEELENITKIAEFAGAWAGIAGVCIDIIAEMFEGDPVMDKLEQIQDSINDFREDMSGQFNSLLEAINADFFKAQITGVLDHIDSCYKAYSDFVDNCTGDKESAKTDFLLKVNDSAYNSLRDNLSDLNAIATDEFGHFILPDYLKKFGNSPTVTMMVGMKLYDATTKGLNCCLLYERLKKEQKERGGKDLDKDGIQEVYRGSDYINVPTLLLKRINELVGRKPNLRLSY